MVTLWLRRAGVFCVSLATLAFEIALTRVFSVAQWYHFAFMSVSVALLGFGASGSLLTLISSRSGQRGEAASKDRLLRASAALFPIAIPGSYLLANYLPFDSYRIASDPIQFLYLAAYYLALTIPFLLGGLIVGLLLELDPRDAHATYAANLLGSAAGGLGAWLSLPWFGGPGTIIFAAMWGVLGGWALLWAGPTLSLRWRRRLLASSGLDLVFAGLVACLLFRPSFLEIRLSPYKAIRQALRVPGAQLTFTAWNAFSRVDVVESPAFRSAPGLSLTYAGPPPVQIALAVDGDNLQPITRRQSGEELPFLSYLPMAAPYLLRPGARALVIEPYGGLAVLVALHHGASSVTAVEGNPLLAQVVAEIYAEYAGHLYQDPRVRLALEEGRTFLHRSRELFDVVEIALSDAYRPVTSGAYSLSEDYMYTQEAFQEALARLAPGGILAATRWLQYPPSEELRLGALTVAALRRSGIEDVGNHVVAFRGWSTATVLAKREPFSRAEIERLRAFCAEMQFDWIHYPGMSPDEANRYHIFQKPLHYEAFAELLSTPDPKGFYSQYEYDVSPPTDNRPFFFHFFKWRQLPKVMQMLGKVWQPFGGSGYLLLLLLLAMAALISALLILLPLALRGGLRSWPHRGRVFLYFAGLGLGYLFLELPFLQRYILFLGQPTLAFSAVLASLLFFSGLGSMMAPRIPWRAGIATLVALIPLYAFSLPRLFDLFLGYSLAARLALTAVSLAPLGLLMGMPFAQGLRIAGTLSPDLVPWAWGINGCASVMASILATMVALSYGFAAVTAAAGGAYLLALLAFWPLSAETGVRPASAGQR